MTVRNFRHSAILMAAATAALVTPLAFAQGGRAHVGATIAGPRAQAATQVEAAPATTPSTTTPASPDSAANANTAPTSAMGAASVDTAAAATEPSATASAAAAVTPATPASPAAASAKRVNWSALDVDKDGKLSKTEAAPVKGLSKVFDQADADKDGALTADEYKAYLAARGKSSHASSGHASSG